MTTNTNSSAKGNTSDEDGCHHEGCEIAPVAADYDWNRWCEIHLREEHPTIADADVATLISLGPDHLMED